MAFDNNGNPVMGNPNPLQNQNQFGQQPNTTGTQQKGDKGNKWDKFPRQNPLDPEKTPKQPEEMEVEPMFKMSDDQKRNLKKKTNERIDRDIKGRRVHIKKKVESIIETETVLEQDISRVKDRITKKLNQIDKDINSAQMELESILNILSKGFPESSGKFMVYRRDLRARAHDVKEISQLVRIEVEKIGKN